MINGASHNIAWGQFQPGIQMVHEAAAIGEPAVHRLRRARLRKSGTTWPWVIKTGRVKIHEFHIANPAPSPPRHRDAVAGGFSSGCWIIYTRLAPPVASTTTRGWNITSTCPVCRFSRAPRKRLPSIPVCGWRSDPPRCSDQIE